MLNFEVIILQSWMLRILIHCLVLYELKTQCSMLAYLTRFIVLPMICTFGSLFKIVHPCTFRVVRTWTDMTSSQFHHGVKINHGSTHKMWWGCMGCSTMCLLLQPLMPRSAFINIMLLHQKWNNAVFGLCCLGIVIDQRSVYNLLQK